MYDMMYDMMYDAHLSSSDVPQMTTSHENKSKALPFCSTAKAEWP